MGSWSFSPVAIIYFSAAGISFLLSYLALYMRPVRGTLVFSFMMFLVGIWITAYVLDLFSNNFDWKILMLKFQYIGMTGAVYLWLVFVAIYTQYDGWLKKPVLIIMALIPVYTLFNIMQAPNDNPLHFYYQLETMKGLTIFKKSYAGGFYLWTSYAYTTMGVGMILLVLRIIKMPYALRKQLFLLVPVVLVIIIPNIFYIIDNNPIEPYDPTPISLVIVGVLFLISMHFHKFLDVMPVAHSLIFRNMRSGVVIINSREHILEINPAAESILKYSQKELAGVNIIKIIPDYRSIINAGKSMNEIKSEITFGNENRTYELKINSLIDGNNISTGKIILLYDITEQKEAIGELDAYARTVAHDLKNPLNNIIGHVQLLTKDCETDSALHQCLDGIIDGSLRMNNIIDGLLLLAQVRNKEKVDVQELDMLNIVKSSILRLSEQIQEKGGQVILPKVWLNSYGHAIWVEEVWINLISNALKYGGEKPLVEIMSYKNGNSIFYSVKDNGTGLNKEEQEDVFIEFNRLSRHRVSSVGHGLGLSIVKRIIDKLGGKVGVDSAPEEGSTFFFSLPAIL